MAGRLSWEGPGEVYGCHQEFEEARGKLPGWAREWAIDAITRGTLVHEAYRKMGWDLDGDIRKASEAFQENSAYKVEEAAFDLRQMWRRLLRRYALWDALGIEGRLWRAEKKTGLPNRWLFRIWRWKDLAIWRLGIAVFAGFGLLASSSGLCETLECLQGKSRWWAIVGAELAVAFFLAFVEVQRRVGRRPWWKVLCGRALLVTALGAAWTAGEILLWTLAIPWSESRPRMLAVCGGTALVLGFIFQLFWQERSIGEPL